MNDSAELHRLVGLVQRLRPDWRDAEAFYELRSEAIGGLRRLAAGKPTPPPPVLPRPPPPPPPVAPRVTLFNGWACRCRRCSKAFRSVQPARYYSNACRQAAYRQRRAAKAVRRSSPEAASV